MLVGQEVQIEMAANTRTVSREMFVTEEKLAGKRLMDLHVWDRYAVIITRIRRAGVEITPVGTSTLELGDTLRVVGDDAALDEFGRLVGGNTRKIDETNMVPFLIGILLGILVGLIPIPLPNGLTDQARRGRRRAARQPAARPLRPHRPVPALRARGGPEHLARAGSDALSRRGRRECRGRSWSR